MRSLAGLVLLFCALVVRAYAVEDTPPPPGSPQDQPRVVSREGVAYLENLRKNTPFGTTSFSLAGLRAGWDRAANRPRPKASN
jgi:hypothetical protein